MKYPQKANKLLMMVPNPTYLYKLEEENGTLHDYTKAETQY